MRAAPQIQPSTGAAVRVLLGGLLVAGGVVAFHKLQPILLPFLFAVLLTALLAPVVDWLDGHRMRRHFAVTAVIAVFLVALLGALTYASAPLISQAGEATTQIEAGIAKLPDLASSIGLDEAETQELLRNAGTRIRDNLGTIGPALSASALSIAGTTVAVLFGVFFTFVLLVYLLLDGRGFWRGAVNLVPADRRATMQRSGERSWRALTIFIRSQVVVASFDAIGIAIGLIVLGIPFVLPLAVMTFALSFVPYIGATVSGVIIGLVALSTDGPTAMLAILGVAMLVQFVEGNFVYPLLIGRNLRMHPITVLLAVGVGAALLGILGAFFATPILATAAAATGRLPGLDDPVDQPGCEDPVVAGDGGGAAAGPVLAGRSPD